MLITLSISPLTQNVRANENSLWGPIIQLSNENEDMLIFPDIAVYENNIHVIWQDNINGNNIFYKRSNDNGQSWDEEIRLIDNNSFQAPMSPSIAVYENNIHVVWQDNFSGNDIFYKRSNDNGENWDEEIGLINENLYSFIHTISPAIAVDGDNVHVVWINEYLPNIYYKKSIDNGETWSNEIVLKECIADSLAITASGNNVHVVWEENNGVENDNQWNIFYKQSQDNGETWIDDMQLSINSSNHETPDIAAEGNNIHVVWVQNSAEGRYIMYTTSSNNGVTWGNNTQLTTDDRTDSYSPSIAINGNNIHIVWQNLHFSPNQRVIYYKRSIDKGNSWGEDIDLAPNVTTEATFPKIAVEDNNIHIVWVEGISWISSISYTHKLNQSITDDLNQIIENKVKTPGFELLMLLSALTAVVLFFRKRRKI